MPWMTASNTRGKMVAKKRRDILVFGFVCFITIEECVKENARKRSIGGNLRKKD